MPNCLIIADNLSHTGGVSSVIFSQIQGLHQLGWQVYLFGMFGPVDDSVKDYLADYFYVAEENADRNRFKEVWNEDVNNKLDAFLKKIDCTQTIAHIHSLSMGLTPAIYKSLLKYNLKYVITAHDAGWACPTGYQYNFKQKKFCELEPMSFSCLATNCDKKKPINKIYKVVKLVALDYFSSLKKNASKIYVPSTWLGKNIASRFPTKLGIDLLLNPVSVTKKPFQVTKKEYFLFIGRLWEEKGIDKFLSITADHYRIKVIGDGGLKSELESKYPSVEFLGKLDHSSTLNYLTGARALVLPSIYLESFGLVVAEALANGVPVIVNKTVGAAFLIEEGKNGFVIDIALSKTVLNACEQLMDDNICYQMSQNAYERYWENPLTDAKYAATLDEEFRKLL